MKTERIQQVLAEASIFPGQTFFQHWGNYNSTSKIVKIYCISSFWQRLSTIVRAIDKKLLLLSVIAIVFVYFNAFSTVPRRE